MTAVDTRALESLFFVSDEPLSASVLAQTLEADRRDVENACDALAKQLEDRGSGLVLRNVAGGWRLFTHPDVAAMVERFVLSSRQARLTKAALETLAIVAYKQPVTRHQVSGIRGVNTDGVLRALQDRGLIEESGREETPGRPVLYGTTPTFLERLGLPSLAALPSLAPLLGPDADEADGELADAIVDTDLDAGDGAGEPQDEDASGAPDEEDAPEAGLLEDDRPA
jgi:segregation and condensation protein B